VESGKNVPAEGKERSDRGVGAPLSLASQGKDDDFYQDPDATPLSLKQRSGGGGMEGERGRGAASSTFGVGVVSAQWRENGTGGIWQMGQRRRSLYPAQPANSGSGSAAADGWMSRGSDRWAIK
jgi:hypothetical protein